MNESSSSDSLELSNEIVASYSLLFDKDKQNFSTSSEISFLKHDFSPIDHNETVTKEISTTTTRINNLPIEESIKFNPFLLLFIQDDEQLTDQIETNLPIDTKESSDEEVRERANPREGLSRMKSIGVHQQCQTKR